MAQNYDVAVVRKNRGWEVRVLIRHNLYKRSFAYQKDAQAYAVKLNSKTIEEEIASTTGLQFVRRVQAIHI